MGDGKAGWNQKNLGQLGMEVRNRRPKEDTLTCKCGSSFFEKITAVKGIPIPLRLSLHTKAVYQREFELFKCLKCGAIIEPDINFLGATREEDTMLRELKSLIIEKG